MCVMVIFHMLYSNYTFLYVDILSFNFWLILLIFIKKYGYVIGFLWVVTVVLFFNYFVIFDNNMKFIKILWKTEKNDLVAVVFSEILKIFLKKNELLQFF